MANRTTVDDIELIIEHSGGGGGNGPPRRDGGGDDGRRRRRPGLPSINRYGLAIACGMASILMFFFTIATAFWGVRHLSHAWVSMKLPGILWANTVVLLASSVTIELARRRLARLDQAGFEKFWRVTTVLGVLFLVGQLVAWRQLVDRGFYIASNQFSSFFYIFTAAHGLHLVGGVCSLIFVLVRKFERARISRFTAADITSYYWHFMDALWIFLLALLYLGR
jgi:cytochrome c oxidase subunit 3